MFFFLFVFTMQWLRYRKIENTVTAKELERLKYSFFVIFRLLSYCVEEAIVFDVNASFVSRPMSRLVEPGDITKEF